jgi:hypothetical protein
LTERLPQPKRVTRECKQAKNLLEFLPRDYHRAHNTAFSGVVSEEVKAKRSHYDINPTKQNATDEEAMARRDEIGRAYRLMTGAFTNIREAHTILNNVLPDSEAAETAPELDSAVGPGYLRELKRYRDQRELRNAGFVDY